jgi:hypothetical protein
MPRASVRVAVVGTVADEAKVSGMLNNALTRAYGRMLLGAFGASGTLSRLDE